MVMWMAREALPSFHTGRKGAGSMKLSRSAEGGQQPKAESIHLITTPIVYHETIVDGIKRRRDNCGIRVTRGCESCVTEDVFIFNSDCQVDSVRLFNSN